MKIIFFILFLSFSSFSVAEGVSEETNLILNELMCEQMSEDLYDLMMLRQDGESLANVVKKARELNETLDDRAFGFEMPENGFTELTWDRYEESVLLFYDYPVKYSKQLKEEESRMVRDTNFSRCYKDLVLAK